MATTTVAITPGSGQAIAIDSNPVLASGAAVQIFSTANSDGSRQPFDPDGTPQVSPEPTTLLLDEFGAQAITVFQTVASGNSGVTPAASGGNVAISAGTANAGYATIRSTLPYWLRAGTYLRISHIVGHETAATANSTRWWGYGTNQATPTATVPVVNGAVFQLDSAAGDLQAAVYSNGTKTTVATLTRRTDGAQHRYEIQYRQSIVYWVIDGVTVASKTYPNLAVATGLYAIAGAANAAAITAPTFNLSSVSVADQGGNSRTISDGFNPGLQATVKAASTAAAATDMALAVAIHPSTPLPAGSNTIGTVLLGSTGNTIGLLAASNNLIGAVAVGSTNARSTSFVTSTGTNAATVSKASAGDIQTLIVANPTSGIQYLKVYNATSVTLGTTAAVLDIAIPAGTTYSLATGPNGLRMITGIAFAITGSAGTTNNTANTAGVTVALTYV